MKEFLFAWGDAIEAIAAHLFLLIVAVHGLLYAAYLLNWAPAEHSLIAEIVTGNRRLLAEAWRAFCFIAVTSILLAFIHGMITSRFKDTLKCTSLIFAVTLAIQGLGSTLAELGILGQRTSILRSLRELVSWSVGPAADIVSDVAGIAKLLAAKDSPRTTASGVQPTTDSLNSRGPTGSSPIQIRAQLPARDCHYDTFVFANDGLLWFRSVSAEQDRLPYICCFDTASGTLDEYKFPKHVPNGGVSSLVASRGRCFFLYSIGVGNSEVWLCQRGNGCLPLTQEKRSLGVLRVGHPGELTALNDELVFGGAMREPNRGAGQPLATETRNGVVSVKALARDDGGIQFDPRNFTVVDDIAYFIWTRRAAGEDEVWATNGAPLGTRRITTITKQLTQGRQPGLDGLHAAGRSLFFQSTDFRSNEVGNHRRVHCFSLASGQEITVVAEMAGWGSFRTNRTDGDTRRFHPQPTVADNDKVCIVIPRRKKSGLMWELHTGNPSSMNLRVVATSDEELGLIGVRGPSVLGILGKSKRLASYDIATSVSAVISAYDELLDWDGDRIWFILGGKLFYCSASNRSPTELQLASFDRYHHSIELVRNGSVVVHADGELRTYSTR